MGGSMRTLALAGCLVVLTVASLFPGADAGSDPCTVSTTIDVTNAPEQGDASIVLTCLGLEVLRAEGNAPAGEGVVYVLGAEVLFLDVDLGDEFHGGTQVLSNPTHAEPRVTVRVLGQPVVLYTDHDLYRVLDDAVACPTVVPLGPCEALDWGGGTPNEATGSVKVEVAGHVVEYTTNANGRNQVLLDGANVLFFDVDVRADGDDCPEARVQVLDQPMVSVDPPCAL